ncbi:hypothetical protein [Sedimenticola sp.]|uniref:hypothetical protein n=2 Tax=Sedimenticola sp. TaxID=1940285 RepID=UPI003D1106FD
MNFSAFDPSEYRQAITKAVAALDSRLQETRREPDIRILQAISQFMESVDHMERLDAETGKGDVAVASEVTRVGNQSLQLLDQISAAAAAQGMSDSVLQLQRLSLPVAFWIAQHQGYIECLELIVNAFSGLANQIDDPALLVVLCEAMAKVQSVVSNRVRQTSQIGGLVDPWRILNLNWGIVATRTHNTALMEEVFGQLVSNIPQDARGFFQEGMQQMDIVGYPDEVRQVMEKYSGLWGSESRLH